MAPLYEQRDDLEEKTQVIEKIMAMAQMFKEYFQLEISDGTLQMLPLLMKGVTPPLRKLPFLIYRLGTKVNYDDEKECLRDVMRQLALFYIPRE